MNAFEFEDVFKCFFYPEIDLMIFCFDFHFGIQRKLTMYREIVQIFSNMIRSLPPILLLFSLCYNYTLADSAFTVEDEIALAKFLGLLHFQLSRKLSC